METDDRRAEDVLRALRDRLAVEGLHVFLPLSAAGFDEVAVARGAPRLGQLLSGARGAVLIGDGGPTFFGHFQTAAARRAPSDAAPDPLDDFTRERVTNAVAEILGSTIQRTLGGSFEFPAEGRERAKLARVRYRLLYPFGGGLAPLPFQRLGEAAGLPAPGPLGIQVHPKYGPWWAYRALVVTSLAMSAVPPLDAWCAGCDRPCVRGCAVHPRPASSADERGVVVEVSCGDACGARGRCPVGVAHGYSAEQVAFHARARQALRPVAAKPAAPLPRAAKPR